MTDLRAGALYNAWHPVEASARAGDAVCSRTSWGPVCESGDFLARDGSCRPGEGDLLAVAAGAYGFAMSSQYNSRSRAAESGRRGRARLARRRGPRKTCWRPKPSLLPPSGGGRGSTLKNHQRGSSGSAGPLETPPSRRRYFPRRFDPKKDPPPDLSPPALRARKTISAADPPCLSGVYSGFFDFSPARADLSHRPLLSWFFGPRSAGRDGF